MSALAERHAPTAQDAHPDAHDAIASLATLCAATRAALDADGVTVLRYTADGCLHAVAAAGHPATPLRIALDGSRTPHAMALRDGDTVIVGDTRAPFTAHVVRAIATLSDARSLHLQPIGEPGRRIHGVLALSWDEPGVTLDASLADRVASLAL